MSRVRCTCVELRYRSRHGRLVASCTVAQCTPALPRPACCADLRLFPPLLRQEASSIPQQWRRASASVAVGPSHPRPPPSSRLPAAPEAPVPGRGARPRHAPAPRRRAHRRGLVGGRGAGGHEDPRPGLCEPPRGAHGGAPLVRPRHGLRPLRAVLAAGAPRVRAPPPERLPRGLLPPRPGAGGRRPGRPCPTRCLLAARGQRREPDRRAHILHQHRDLAGRVRGRRRVRDRRRPDGGVRRVRGAAGDGHGGGVRAVAGVGGHAHGAGRQGGTVAQGDGQASRAGHLGPPPGAPQQRTAARWRRGGRSPGLRGRAAGRQRGWRRLRGSPVRHGRHQGHYPGHVRRCHRHDLHDSGMGRGGAHQQPIRDAQAPGRDPRGRQRRQPRHGGPSGEDELPEGRDQGDPPAARASAAPPAPGDARGHGAAGLPRPGADPRGGERVGHQPRPDDVGARRGVRPGEVRGWPGGVRARAGLQVRAVRRRKEGVPRRRLRRAVDRPGAREPAVPFRLGAATGGRGAEAGHERAVWAVCPAQGHAASGC